MSKIEDLKTTIKNLEEEIIILREGLSASCTCEYQHWANGHDCPACKALQYSNSQR